MVGEYEESSDMEGGGGGRGGCSTSRMDKIERDERACVCVGSRVCDGCRRERRSRSRYNSSKQREKIVMNYGRSIRRILGN